MKLHMNLSKEKSDLGALNTLINAITVIYLPVFSRRHCWYVNELIISREVM